MKKITIYIISLICSVFFLSACTGEGQNEIKSPIIGTWNVPAVEVDENENFVEGCLFCVWEAPEDATLWVLPIKDMPLLIESLGSAMIPQMLKDITFLKNGNIIATYSESGMDLENPNPVWVTSPEGYVSFELVNDSKLLLHLNEEKIQEEMKSKAEEELVENLFAEGIPMNYSISSDEKELKLFIDKDFMVKIAEVAPVIAELIPDDGLDGMGALIKAILADMPNAFAKTTKFECGLRLTK